MIRIAWDSEVRSMDDSIVKILPVAAAATPIMTGLLEQKKVKEQELAQVEQDVEGAEGQDA